MLKAAASVENIKGEGERDEKTSGDILIAWKEATEQAVQAADHRIKARLRTRLEEDSKPGRPAAVTNSALLTRVRLEEKFNLCLGVDDIQSEDEGRATKECAQIICNEHITDPNPTKISKAGEEGTHNWPISTPTLSALDEGQHKILALILQSSDDPRYLKYGTMLKVGLDPSAVCHSMVRDGLDPDSINNRVANDNTVKRETNATSAVPLRDDPRFEKYFRMLRMGLPAAAVSHAAERDGLDPSVIDCDPDAPAPPPLQPSQLVLGENVMSGGLIETEPSKQPSDNLRHTRVYWDELESSKTESIWALLEDDPDLLGIEIDEEEFVRLFQAERVMVRGSNPRGRGGNSGRPNAKVGVVGGGDAVKVVDPKRANNGGIILARVKMSYDDIARAIAGM